LLLGLLEKTTTKVTTSGTPSQVGQPVTFTATISSNYGSISDGETVTFLDGSTVIGTGITSSGVVRLTTSSLTVNKTHTIKATYAGDATFAPSTGTVSQYVVKDPTITARDFQGKGYLGGTDADRHSEVLGRNGRDWKGDVERWRG
jgi:hypothetical protein